MKNTQFIVQKPPPYFPKGVLEFADSGHVLTRNGKYYVCEPKQKMKCKDESEKAIVQENLETNFSRLADTMRITGNENLRIFDNTFKEILHFQIDYIFDSPMENEVFDATLEAIAADIKLKKKRYLASDIADAKEAFFKQVKKNTVDVAISLLGAVLSTFVREASTKTELGRSLAYFTEHIQISKDGEIEKIKLNSIGSYIYCFIKKRFPSFGEIIKEKLEYKKFESLDLKTLAEKIKSGEIKDVIPQDPLNTAYGRMAMTQYLITNSRNMKPENLLMALLIMENSAMIGVLFTARRLLKSY